MHKGSAYEGTVGSYYKIDAGYLSEDVYQTLELAKIVRMYKTPIILSEKTMQQLSLKVQACCREIDKIKYKGNVMRLYTIDVSTENCIEEPIENLNKSYLERRLEMRDDKTDLFEKRYKLKVTPYHLMTSDDDWRMMRKTLDRAVELKVMKLQAAY